MNSNKVALGLIALGFAGMAHASTSTANCTSHVFVPRGISTDLTYINALTFYDVRVKEKDKKFSYVGEFLFQNSRKSPDLGAAFLLGTSNTITVQQPPITAGAISTVNSFELGLGNSNPATPFSATFSIDPQRKVYGYHGYFYANLDDCWCGLWFDLAVAILNVRHNLHCVEVDTYLSNACPNIYTVSDALSNPGLFYSDFFCGLCNNEKRRTGFDDVQFRLGYDYDWCDDAMVSLYLVGTAPGGRKADALTVFEPLVGTTHASVGVGFLGDYTFGNCMCEGSDLTLMTDFNYRYVFSHNECRTFDLLPQGAFSRYYPVINLAQPQFPFPAANVLTEKVKVQPRSTIQWWLGLNYEYCNWDFEIGYNLWWRQKEQIKESSIIVPANISLYDITGGNATSALTLANIDVASAVAGRALTNKVYGAFSTFGCVCEGCFDWMGGVGASYEFVTKHDRCSALQNWAVFVKGAVSF